MYATVTSRWHDNYPEPGIRIEIVGFVTDPSGFLLAVYRTDDGRVGIIPGDSILLEPNTAKVERED